MRRALKAMNHRTSGGAGGGWVGSGRWEVRWGRRIGEEVKWSRCAKKWGPVWLRPLPQREVPKSRSSCSARGRAGACSFAEWTWDSFPEKRERSWSVVFHVEQRGQEINTDRMGFKAINRIYHIYAIHI